MWRMIENEFEDNFPSGTKPTNTQPVNNTEPQRQADEKNINTGETMPTPTTPVPPADTTPVAQTQVSQTAASLADTGPQRTAGAQKAVRKKRLSAWLIAILGLLAIVLVAGLSALGGYFSGIDLRLNAEGTQVGQAAQQQYEMAVQNIDAGEYALARQRLEYVLRIDPNYPGAVDKLADVLLELNTTATPTLSPTATVQPTADTRGVEELLTQAQQAVINGEWQTAIDALNSLRNSDPEFHAVEVDGLYFIAFRNLGSDKILKESNLEEGMYQLSLAERFGLLDAEARALATWSSLYVKGASFWELDWGQATFYFAQVAPYAPNLRDGSGLTSMQRYQTAIVKYIQQLFNDKNWCEAKAQLEIALTMMQDPELQNALVTATERCAAEKK
jgi:hypothetical protein